MKIPTSYVRPDEPSRGLFEGPRSIPGKGKRWIQAIYVIRDDTIAEYVQDLGSASDYERIQPMFIPGFGDDTVAEVQALAEKNRHDTYWAGRVDEMLAGSTLIEDHLKQLEVNRLAIRNRSQFGPGYTAQRNGYPRAAAKEKYA
ncbi:hypothetical protein LCGC14_1773740 [marine sediment metagenome]|uniref:Uncharacterized protein n=1 Tax=marine sediment metagenome TaxID=412755 RepID=A0A0F9GXK5_9ZZZZ